MRLLLLLFYFIIYSYFNYINCFSYNKTRLLSDNNNNNNNLSNNKNYLKYFKGLNKIYNYNVPYCIQYHKENGWKNEKKQKNLPLYVIAIGTEASGHQMWKMLLDTPVFDCIWPLPSKTEPAAGSHLSQSGYPFLTSEDLEDSLSSQLVLSSRIASKECKSIYDAFSSFPFGSPRNNARHFHHPDLINLRKLDGVLFNVKYLLLFRNLTDSALTTLGRKSSVTVDDNLRTYEQSLVYLESALKGIPCEKLFFASWEHVRHSPEVFISPLIEFLELKSDESISALTSNFQTFSKKKKILKFYPLLPLQECSFKKEKLCYDHMEKKFNSFFNNRKEMWPLFSGNGNNIL